MNNFYGFFRCAMMLAILLPMTLWGQITPTTDSNGNGTIEDSEKVLYLIQTNQFESFYMVPTSNEANVTTNNIPNVQMLWYFLDAGEVSGTQYYYIISNSTGKCIYNHNGNDRGISLTVLDDLSDANKEKCKFKLVENNSNETVGFYNIEVKANQTYYGLNKQGGSVNIANPIRLTNNLYINEYNSKWKFIPYNGSFTWPDPPFTPSTTNQKFYFKINNKTNGSYYVSSDASSPKNVTISSTESNNMVWYFKEASTDSWIKYYYIVNPEAGEYMYYKGTATDGSDQDNAIVLKEKTSENEDRFQFIIVQTARIVKINKIDVPVEAYTIIPKLLKDQYWNSNCISPTSIANGNKLGIRNGRGSDTNNSHWVFVETVYSVPVEAPTITNNYDGTISLSTATDDATIYYTTNGNTPDNNSTEYGNEPFSLGDATVIKAIAYLDPNYSNVSTYNVPQYDAPTISLNGSTLQVTISGLTGATIYYTTDASVPTASNYTGTGTTTVTINNVSLGTTVKAIATHAGYLTSNVAELTITKVATPTIQNNGNNAISITCDTEGATIYYTTDGNDPTTSSTEYTEPLTAGVSNVTIKAIAVKENMINSEVGSGKVKLQCAPPVIRKTSPTTFTITCSFPTNDATIRYNIGDNHEEPTDPTPESGTIYNGEVTFSESNLPFIVKAIAYATEDYNNSVVETMTIAQEHDYSQYYLTFNVITDGTIAWKSIGSGHTETIYYSKNGGAWTSIEASSTPAIIEVVAGNNVRFKGTNTAYATNKDNYAGFEGGTAKFNIEGNIMSLIYGDNFIGKTTLSETYNFCSLFKQSKAVSAENLILPATSLTDYCYRSMFSKCTTLEVAPALPATQLAKGCYWYLFEDCAITTAPELLATNLVQECYGYMFKGCSSLNYIKCLATTGFGSSNCLSNWVNNVSPAGFFVKDTNATWPATGTSSIPSGWTIYNDFFLYGPEISCDGEYITITCATEGASIHYRLNQTGEFSEYSLPLSISETTFIEAYSHKESNTSNIVSDTFVIYDNPFDESTRSLDTWTYGNTQVTLPYSVNGVNGHTSNYSKGTYPFETTITLYKEQPTYLWFQHADQSADIYVNNTFVTTHWGGYNAFFVNITDYVHVGTNRIKVVLNNTTRNALAPADGDFNFNATLGKVKLLTSPIMPLMDYGYDGFHITATDVSSSSATINIKTSVPLGASVICKIDADDENYHFTETKASTGNEITFTTTISNPHLWNGIADPFLYNVTLEIRDNVHNELYHRYQRPYGFRYYAYDTSTGFLLNGEPYKLRGVCMHDDLEGKANALNDDDYAQEFAIIQDLGCNFIRLAHYPHPKEVYDWCDRLGIIVQTEVPCVEKFNKCQSDGGSWTDDYYTHLGTQYADMVNQHYNHPCIMFWGLGNEITTNDKPWAKTKLEYYRTLIKTLDPERWVGYVVSHSYSNPSGMFNNPNMDWFGCNIYVGWYINNGTNGELLNDPTYQLTTRKNNIIRDLNKPLAFSEYGCGGTQHCHSDNPQNTTTKGTKTTRHDIEYQMWLHEGHIAAIKNFPELLFTSQWQLFDLAVSERNEGYTICLDGESTSIDNNLRYLNNKGLVERDHKTKKDPFYLYKAWWNQTDKFVHICGKDYEKIIDRVIKCYTNDGSELRLFVNNEQIQTATVVDNIATFTATDFRPGDVIRVNGATTDDTFTFPNVYVFKTDGNWDVAANWNANAVPANGSDAAIRAACTIPDGVVAQANNITIDENGTLTIEDGGQLQCSNAVSATFNKNITASSGTDGWYTISSPINTPVITDVTNLVSGGVGFQYNLYRYNEEESAWEAYNLNSTSPSYHADFTNLVNGQGYLYRNNNGASLSFTGPVNVGDVDITLTSTEGAGELRGFNLIGNPFGHNIYKGKGAAIDNTGLSDGYYFLNHDGGWQSATYTTAIPPMMGILVQVSGDDNLDLTIQDKPTDATAERYANDNLMFTVANSQYEDVTYALFHEGNGLNKINHRNADIPMLYINQNNGNYAIAMMKDNTQSFNLNFKAMTMGQYTLSYKTTGEFNYLHVIDRLTGNDIDMLLEGKYSFIGSPQDNEARFIVRLGYLPNYYDNDENIFAYQNGSDIIVSGEGELQIFDVMGRMVSTQNINGTETISVKAQGVYVLRLVGTEYKTQKIVVR